MKTSTLALSQAWQLMMLTLLAAIMIAMPDLALAVDAGTDTPIGNVFCTVKNWFTGNTGKGLATIAITIIGIGALLGKVSWGMAMIVGVGVAVVFGASGIVDAINAGADSGCATDAAF